MTTDQWFVLLLSALGVIFTIMSALLTLLWRAGRTSGQVSTQIQHLVEDVASIVRSLDEHIKWHLANKR